MNLQKQNYLLSILYVVCTPQYKPSRKSMKKVKKCLVVNSANYFQAKPAWRQVALCLKSCNKIFFFSKPYQVCPHSVHCFSLHYLRKQASLLVTTDNSKCNCVMWESEHQLQLTTSNIYIILHLHRVRGHRSANFLCLP